MNKYIILILGLLGLGIVQAQNLEYRINSMGFKVADLRLSIGKDNLYVKASNSGFRTIFPHINNIYRVSFDADFMPQSYVRVIHQSELKDIINTSYHKNSATMHRKSSNESISYTLPAPSHDIFTLLAKISQSEKPIGEYLVDGNGRPWKAIVSGGKVEDLKTSLGKFQTRKYELRFKALNANKAPYIDMLTHNFLDEDLHLSIWVNQGGIPVKAHLRKKLVVITWEILSIS
ncbi:MAG: DUF3108 domain-containing protein [Candidatus Cloacimonetes bacterium]|nr:DUF3108 domain-containing protein [Candidatus Cloacimonadota bacterium]HOA29026.1 DUF3108 domain-containing protein [Candidatus Cloacimonadota bacterium]HOH60018.1 DUF3108 domain-containing protein [Candidatus Cloacimonadota bacterium]HPI24983.1 DUF3108 domain-containing protein [Candidatus Cloacimonadota bacterium]